MASDGQVVIHIDKKEYRVPDPTTGLHLYQIASVDSATYDLFREVPGKGDDEQIFANGNSVHVKNGDHFFSAQKKLNPGV